jgi:probable rRNA maturation factor
MNILVTNRQTVAPVDVPLARQSMAAILKSLEMEGHEVSLLFVDDTEITEINRHYLGRNHPTNVIAFSMNEGEFGAINPLLLGDIVISVETALRDARVGDLPLEDEINYLMIHGVLHLLGYDHEQPREAEEMEKKEKEIFFALKKYQIE